MATVTITIRDDGEDNATINIESDPPFSNESTTTAQALADIAITAMQNAGTTTAAEFEDSDGNRKRFEYHNPDDPTLNV